jgi:hypothetical protein
MELKTLQFTTEAFSKPYKYTWQAFKEDRGLGSFLIPGGWVDLEISISHTLSFTTIATIIFSRNTENYDTGVSDETYDISGQGDAFRIFATVLKMIEEWVKKYGETVDIITFTAEKEKDPKGSRAKLYHRMAKKFTPKGWKYEKDPSSSRAVRFKLVNLNPKPKESKYKI